MSKTDCLWCKNSAFSIGHQCNASRRGSAVHTRTGLVREPRQGQEHRNADRSNCCRPSAAIDRAAWIAKKYTQSTVISSDLQRSCVATQWHSLRGNDVWEILVYNAAHSFRMGGGAWTRTSRTRARASGKTPLARVFSPGRVESLFGVEACTGNETGGIITYVACS
jgi:hypothetical protein